MAKQVNVEIARVLKATGVGVTQGLVAAAEHVLNVSNDHVPHETGDLERTGVTSIDPGSNRAAVSYKDADYAGQAADQHENLSYHHDSGRNAKFLENAVNSERATVSRILQQAIRNELGT